MERRKPWAVFTAYAVFLVTAFPECAAAQQHLVPQVPQHPVSQHPVLQHLVPLGELHQRLRQSAESRARDAADIERVLSLPAAQEAMEKASVDPARVWVALSVLSDQELSRLADRARSAEQDVQGGLIVGLLALIGLIVVILIVVAAVK